MFKISVYLLSGDTRLNEWAVKSIPTAFGDPTLVSLAEPKTCGVIFVSEANQTISRQDSESIQHFFTRDGAEAQVFEFDRFEGDFKARRWEQIAARTRQIPETLSRGGLLYQLICIDYRSVMDYHIFMKKFTHKIDFTFGVELDKEKHRIFECDALAALGLIGLAAGSLFGGHTLTETVGSWVNYEGYSFSEAGRTLTVYTDLRGTDAAVGLAELIKRELRQEAVLVSITKVNAIIR
jgi:hypothetical protein